MNILHMKYAVEVARAGSINKASENLLIAQPNLSRSIKELEADLGITIFDRTSKGMKLTPDGEEFMGYAFKILTQIDDVEKMYKESAPVKQKFSVCVPRATYISNAFANFSNSMSTGSAEFFYKETNSARTIDYVQGKGYKLGIIRYPTKYDPQFKHLLEEKGLAYELLVEFRYVLIMNRDSRLAEKQEIHFSDLEPMIEIAYADPFVPSVPVSEVKKEELPEHVKRRIFVFDRASQFNILFENPETYMWVSPIPERVLNIYHLTQRECPDNKKLYRDMLIYKKGYSLSEMDEAFVKEIYKIKMNTFY